MNFDLSIKIIREIQKDPAQGQRTLSKNCGVSLGSVNYCINVLVKKGYLQAKNYKNAQNKIAYTYNLTPSGVDLKKGLTLEFLKHKRAEYDLLKQEIKMLKEELSQ